MAWFHCFAGIAGDMALGSLLDAGADLREVLALLERLPLRGWGLEVEPVLRGGIAATRAVVSAEDTVVVRTYAHIVGLVGEARLPERVTRRALATFAALADVEARLHRRPVDQVHFHEVGGHDTIVDVVGTAAALEVLGIDEVQASPVATGPGHGAGGARHAAQSGPGGGGPAGGSAHLGPERAGGADHADRRRPPGRPGVGVRPHAGDAGHRTGVRGGDP